MLSHPHVDAGEACRTDVLYHKLVVEAEYFYLEPPFFSSTPIYGSPARPYFPLVSPSISGVLICNLLLRAH